MSGPTLPGPREPRGDLQTPEAQRSTESNPPRVGFGSLAEALERETKLLTDLQAVLRQQREAVATEDLGGVDDTIFAAQRILRTLAEARIKRRTLLELLGGDPDLPLEEVEEDLEPRVTPEVREALGHLREVALKLAGELEVNRKVLESAFQSGEELIRALGGKRDGESGVYGPAARPSADSGDHGMIIDRQI